MGTLVVSDALGFASTSTALSYTLPASPAIAAGDLIVIAVYHGNAATHSGVTAGYTAGATGTNGTACKGTVYTKTAAGGEEGSTFALTLSSSSSKVVALQVWRGVTLDSVNNNQTGASANVVSPAVTATAQPGVALAIGGGRGAADGSQPGVTTWPSGYTSGPSASSTLAASNRNTGCFISSLAITSTTVASATTVATQSLSYVGLTVVLTDSSSAVNADASVSETHSTSATASATSPIDASHTDTHAISATISATSPINASHTDTHGTSASATATSPGVENANASVSDTHGTSATASATSPINASHTDTHGTSASATVTTVMTANASSVVTMATSASATATSPFPFGETDVRVRLDLDGSGAFATDITDWVELESKIMIVRGRQSEGNTADAATMKLKVNNSDHRFSKANVDGPYFGQLVRNTAIRADLPLIGDHYLDAPHGVALALTTPDSAGLSITGDLDVRVDLAMIPSWRPAGTGMTVINKWNTTGNQRSWALTLDNAGRPVLFWSNNGTAVLSATCAVPVNYAPVRQSIRATIDVNNGAGGNTVTFYTAASLAGTWVQLGSPVVTAGTTSIFDSTAPLALGDTAANNGRVPLKVYGAAVLQGIAGTLRANLSLATVTDGAASVTDTIGNVWTPATGARLTGRDIRYTGRVPSWPEEHGRIDDDSSVSITAYDVIRRIGRSRSPLASAYKRGCLSTVAPVTGLVAYWPMEDPAGATRAAAGRSGDRAMQVIGTPDWAADSSFACSTPLPKAGTASFAGIVLPYAATGEIQVRCLMSVPAAGTTNGAVLLRLACSGTAVRWDVVYGTGGTLAVNAYDSSGASVLSSGAAAFLVDGLPLRLSLGVKQNGTGVDWTLGTLLPGTDSGGLLNGTLASNTVTLAKQVTLAATRNLGDTVLGHVTVQSAVTGTYDLDDQLMAYQGEDAAGRIARVAAEEGFPWVPIGGGGPKLGAQLPIKLLDLLRECETSDAGLLYTPRDSHGIAYRPLRTLTNRDPVLSLAHDVGAIDTLAPIPDDQATANDVTASRAAGGSSVRYTKLTGPLSVLDPPLGAGQYDGDLTVSALGDDVLEDHASWAVHIGTVDEDRVPGIGFNLGSRYFDGSATPTAVAAAIAALDIGDRILVTSVPTSWGGLDDIDQLAIGLTEEIGVWEHKITAVCAPARPYNTLRWGVGDRWTTAGSTVNGAHVLGDATLSVSTPGGSLWGHGSGDFDVRIAGRTMTVTGVSGTSSPQVFTIAGGIPAALAGGETVELAQRRFWAM